MFELELISSLTEVYDLYFLGKKWTIYRPSKIIQILQLKRHSELKINNHEIRTNAYMFVTYIEEQCKRYYNIYFLLVLTFNRPWTCL